jgi:hypothetical protein
MNNRGLIMKINIYLVCLVLFAVAMTSLLFISTEAAFHFVIVAILVLLFAFTQDSALHRCQNLLDAING